MSDATTPANPTDQIATTLAGYDEDVRLVRGAPLTPDERVAMWKVARGLGRTRDEYVLLNALYHDHADCAAGRGLSPLHDALLAEHEAYAQYRYEAWVSDEHDSAHDEAEALRKEMGE